MANMVTADPRLVDKVKGLLKARQIKGFTAEALATIDNESNSFLDDMLAKAVNIAGDERFNVIDVPHVLVAASIARNNTPQVNATFLALGSLFAGLSGSAGISVALISGPLAHAAWWSSGIAATAIVSVAFFVMSAPRLKKFRPGKRS
ncbi:hypothetical protein D2E76_26970 [Mycobacteroides abscessus]|uniref:Transmembrane protein n=1 Tax=Mycobacteroides abscessus TaxID=36809 RepID=A0ABD7HH61_9MYCO|nr:hypothetical protein D2E76_26970 [Mycobacteroides abscessus]